VRIGVMVGPERGRYSTKVERLLADAKWAEEAGLAAVWVPQIPDDFDALTAATLIGAQTTRIEIGTAVVPVQPRHPIVLAQQVLSTQAVCQGRLTLGLGVSHHWVIDEMLGLPYERPAATMRAYLDVLDQALSGPGMVDVENEMFRVQNPLDITDVAPTSVLIAALGPLMLRLAGERTDGTILWLADERAIGSHIAPTITAAAEGAGRRPPRIVAGVPVCLCRDDEVDVAMERANRVLSEAMPDPSETSWPRAASHRSRSGCGPSPTRVRRTCRCESCPSVAPATRSWRRRGEPATTSRRSPVRSDHHEGRQ
jgi:F420-dependent oxidoreductase-like protein